MAGAGRERVAQALAFFDACDDPGLLHGLLEEIAPRVKRMVAQLLRKGDEDAIPAPAEVRSAREPSTRDEAVATVRQTQDFALLQTLARSIGRRVEALEIAASAEFPEGVRVLVPAEMRYPASEPSQPGEVEVTGTMIEVVLDNGETWRGPASLARLER